MTPRRKTAKRQDATLAPEWELWAYQNLLRGASARDVADGLVQNGAPSELADREVARVLASPAFRAAQPFARESRRYRLLASLFARLARQSHEPESIERTAWPGTEAFRDRYLATNTPVVFTDLSTDWPAIRQWSLEHFSRKYGAVQVRVTHDREANPDYDMQHEKHTKTMSLRDYIARVCEAADSNDVYMVANNRNLANPALQALFADIALPPDLIDMQQAHHGSALWIGPKGTVTPLHHDTSNILFCQIVGSKRYRMIAPHQIALLDGARSMYGGVDPEQPDLERYPWWPNVLVKDVVLGAGDTLFIPVGWWHHVRALSASISIAFNNFALPNRFEDYVPALL